MQLFNQTVIAAFLIYNVVIFLMYGCDKSRAIRGEWRIPEKTLLTFTALFGSIGALLGMRFFHHKTLKPRFFVGVRLMMIAHVFIIFYVSKLL